MSSNRNFCENNLSHLRISKIQILQIAKDKEGLGDFDDVYHISSFLQAI